MRKLFKGALASVACFSVGAAAYAAVIFDPFTGTGFVGKGDVQLALNWNNPRLQAEADSLVFAVEGTIETEVSWICTNSNNENVQMRLRTTTTTTRGVLDGVARVKNQITGFNLEGYVGVPTESSETEGPPLNSCPSGPWSLTIPAGDPAVISSSFDLTVNGVPLLVQ